MLQDFLREIPKVDDMVRIIASEPAFEGLSRYVITDAARKATEEFRRYLLDQKEVSSKEVLVTEVYDRCRELIIDAYKTSLRRVINGTGVVLHTNLGRAVLSRKAAEAVQEVSTGYCNLEMALDTGERGSRYSHVEELLIRLTGAESCLVVNNNAAAVVLALTAIAKGKEVIVSRGQLVEIGGAFRIPEVMEQSGAKLVEVGSTNKTYLEDYQKAITSESGLLLRVHTSNYKISGFTHTTKAQELAGLGEEYGIPVMEDLGSGCLIKLNVFGIPDEPTVNEILAAGVDIITFSGDKLLGGPQAGIILGRKEHLDLMKKHPLNRAVRVDKFTIAALEATLRQYLDLKLALTDIPTLEMLTRPLEILRRQALKLSRIIKKAIGANVTVSVKTGSSEAGGGSLPTVNLPTWLVYLHPQNIKVDTLARKMRVGEPAILAHIQEDAIVFDPRTLLYTRDYQQIAMSLKKILLEGEA